MNLFNKISKKENIYAILFIIITFFLDRFSKSKILNDFNENVYFINNFINLELIWNKGIGFGLLNFSSVFIYNIITSIIGSVIFFLFFVAFKADKYEKIVFSIIIGGALGNLYDRIFYKAVPDFIDLHYGNFHWFSFNIADIFITIGVLAFIMKSLSIKT
tara:strand:+ start:1001 stop:1480 length:480 start_codon:yes stop_codon:yes gene_type:complete